MKNRAKRKKLSPMHKAWLKQAASTIKFLEQLPDLPTIHGDKWTHKMIDHYYSKLANLHVNTPRGCKKRAEEYMVRAKRVRAWSHKNR